MENQKMAELFQEIDDKLKNVFQLRTIPMRDQTEQSRMEVVGSLLYLYNDSWTVDNTQVIIGVPSTNPADAYKKPSVLKKFSKWLTLAELGHLIPEGSSITNSKKFPQLVTSLMNQVERRHGTAGLGAKVRMVVQKETRKVISGGGQSKVKATDQKTTNTSLSLDTTDPPQADLSLTPKRTIPSGKQLPRTPSSQEKLSSAQAVSLETTPVSGLQSLSSSKGEDPQFTAVFQPAKQLLRTPPKNVSMSSNNSLETTLNESTRDRIGGSFYSPVVSPRQLKRERSRRPPLISASEFNLSKSLIIHNGKENVENKDLQSPSAPNSNQAPVSASEFDGLSVKLTPKSTAPPPTGRQLARTPVSAQATLPIHPPGVCTSAQVPIHPPGVCTSAQDNGCSTVETAINNDDPNIEILQSETIPDYVPSKPSHHMETESFQDVNSLTTTAERTPTNNVLSSGTPKSSRARTPVPAQVLVSVINDKGAKLFHQDGNVECRSQTEKLLQKCDNPEKVSSESEAVCAPELESLNTNVGETPRRSAPTSGKQLARTPVLAAKSLDKMDEANTDIRYELAEAPESNVASSHYSNLNGCELTLKNLNNLGVDSAIKKAKNIIPTGNQIPNTPDNRLLQCNVDYSNTLSKRQEENAIKTTDISTTAQDEELKIEAEIKRKLEETERLRQKLETLKRIEEEKRLLEEEIRKLASQDKGEIDVSSISNVQGLKNKGKSIENCPEELTKQTQDICGRFRAGEEMEKKDVSAMQIEVLNVEETYKGMEAGKIHSKNPENKTDEILMKKVSQKDGGLTDILDEEMGEVNKGISEELRKENGTESTIVEQNLKDLHNFESKSDSIKERNVELRENGKIQSVPSSKLINNKQKSLKNKKSDEVKSKASERVESKRMADTKTNNEENGFQHTGDCESGSKTDNHVESKEEMEKGELGKYETSLTKEDDSKSKGNQHKINVESKLETIEQPKLQKVKECHDKKVKELQNMSKPKTPHKEIVNKKSVEQTSPLFDISESEKLKKNEKLEEKVSKLDDGISGGKKSKSDEKGSKQKSKVDEKGKSDVIVTEENNELKKPHTQSAAPKQQASPGVNHCERVNERKELINESIKRGQEKKEERKKLMEQFEEKRNVKKKIRIGRKPTAPAGKVEMVKSNQSTTEVNEVKVSAADDPNLHESSTKLMNTTETKFTHSLSNNVNQDHCEIDVDGSTESWQIPENLVSDHREEYVGTGEGELSKLNGVDNVEIHADDLIKNADKQLKEISTSAQEIIIAGPTTEISGGDVENRENIIAVDSVKKSNNKKIPASNSQQKRESINQVSEASPAKKLNLGRGEQVFDSSRPLRTSRSRKTVNYCETKPVSPIVKKLSIRNTPNKVKTIDVNNIHSEEAVTDNKRKVLKKNVVGTPNGKCPVKTNVMLNSSSSLTTPKQDEKPKTSSRLTKVKKDSEADKDSVKSRNARPKRSSTGLNNDISSPKKPNVKASTTDGVGKPSPKKPNIKASTADGVGKPKRSSRSSARQSTVTDTKKKDTKALEVANSSGLNSPNVRLKAAKGKTKNAESDSTTNSARKRSFKKPTPPKKIEEIKLEQNAVEDKLSENETSKMPTRRPARNAKNKIVNLEGFTGSCSGATPSPYLPAKDTSSKSSTVNKKTTSKKSDAKLPVKSSTEIVAVAAVHDIQVDADRECVSNKGLSVEHSKDTTNSNETDGTIKVSRGGTKSRSKISGNGLLNVDGGSVGANTNEEKKQTRKRKQNRPRRSIGGVLQDIEDAVYKTPDSNTNIPDEFYVTPKAQGVFGPVTDEEYMTPTLPATIQAKKRSTRSTRNR